MELLLSQRENAGTKDLPCQGHRYQTSRSAPVSSRKINVEFWDPWLTRNFAFVLLMESTMSATTIIIMQKFKWIITQYAFCRHSYLTLLRIMWNMPYTYHRSGVSESLHILSYAILHHFPSRAAILILDLLSATAKYYFPPFFVYCLKFLICFDNLNRKLNY